MQQSLFTTEAIQQLKYNLLQVEIDKRDLLLAQKDKEIQSLKYSQRSYKGGATKRKKKL